MYRVLVSGVLGVLVAGCSLGFSKPLSFGFSDNAESRRAPDTTASLGDAGSTAPTPRPVTASQRVAKLDDRAPNGSFEKAPQGALTGRDYSTTSLNAEMARDVINAYRKQNGLKPVKLDATLTNAAKAHSRDLAKWDRISHYGSDGSNPWDRVKRTGYNARLAAENVGTGQIDFNEVMKGWQQSPGHNKNLLLADAEHIGIALVTDPKTEFKTFWTLVLASPM
jgi:uncharacterized protein YkwD